MVVVSYDVVDEVVFVVDCCCFEVDVVFDNISML